MNQNLSNIQSKTKKNIYNNGIPGNLQWWPSAVLFDCKQEEQVQL